MTPPESEVTVPLRPDDSTFGARLALARHAKGMNIKEAAAAAGFPGQSWRSWELDGRMPRDYVAVCRQIAERLEVELTWLVGLDAPARATA
jgi:transcriptional regulator with XRE-family HTH domain